MAEIMTPGMMMGMGGGGSNDGLFGGGGGGGLIGGLILGSLLRQGNNGGLFGGNGGDGAGAAGALLRSPPEQVTANMSLMQAIGAVDKSVAVNAATFEASQATQSLGITTQLSSVASALTNNLNLVNTNVMQGNAVINQNIMENRYELSKDISNDGEKTRALIVAQYEATLNRQLGDANAEIIALRSRSALDAATSGITLTNTNNINQMQSRTNTQLVH